MIEETKIYSAEVLDKVLAMYEELGNEGISDIATTVGKTPHSIRSKLVKIGKYNSTPKTVDKNTSLSKKELLRELSKKIPDLTEEELKGFETATKVALTKLIGLISN